LEGAQRANSAGSAPNPFLPQGASAGLDGGGYTRGQGRVAVLHFRTVGRLSTFWRTRLGRSASPSAVASGARFQTFGWPVIRPESMPSAAITSYKPTSRYLCACPDLDYFRFVDHSGNDTGSVRVLCQRCGEHALHNVSKVWVQGGATSQQVGESNKESTTGRCWPFQLRFPPPHCAVTVDVTRRRLVSCRFCCLPLWAKALLER
jgi:hypothetical protein